MSSLRIIAGTLRRRRIRVPAGGVRPTGDRIREALFSILAAEVPQARVLDLYAGSGALGFEALSRGACELWAVESSRRTCADLEATARELGVADRCRVVHASVLNAVGQGRLAAPFDLILADPPYELDEVEALPDALDAAGLLAAGGVLVVEVDARRGPLPSNSRALERFREARYGRTRLEFFRLVRRDPAVSRSRP